MSTQRGLGGGSDDRRFRVVSFHAHPDDESLLTGGTLARAATEGHRVVVVVATAGEAGLTAAGDEDLGTRRLGELHRAAAELGVARVLCLGYSDSGLRGESSDPNAFVTADETDAASRLAAILTEERADVLTSYDRAGGYGHPDHVKVHRVARLAAAMSGVPVLLEATVDRRPLLRLARTIRPVPRLPQTFRPHVLLHAFSDHDELTHRVNVRPYLARKRAAFAAHGSQLTGGSGVRSLAIYLRMPRFLFAVLFGREWFVEVGRPARGPLADDIFATLREQQQTDRSNAVRAAIVDAPDAQPVRQTSEVVR